MKVVFAALLLLPVTAVAERSPWSFSAGPRLEAAAEHGLGGSQAGARWRFSESFALDLVGRQGYLSSYEEGLGDHAYVALLAGITWQGADAGDGWTPNVSARLAHIHHATAESWAETPGANIAGDSNGGVEHRSGAELAVGLLGPRLYSGEGWHLRWSVELSGTTLPSSEVMGWSMGLTGGVALGFD
ncbi:MAG: hypothetical protein ACE366_21920 [Bradymonadia bacterium]